MAPRHRGPWSAEEDEKLLGLVIPLNYDWVKIEKHMGGTRNAKQCRERYQQQLKPELNHEPITDEEGRFILNYVSIHGKHWAHLSRKLPGRSDNCIKNWWNGQQNRRRKQRREGSNGYSDDQFRPDTPYPSSHQASAPPAVPRTLPSDLYLAGYHNDVHGQAGHYTRIDSPLSSPGSARTAESDQVPSYTTTPRRPLLLPFTDPFDFGMPREWGGPWPRSRQKHGAGAVSPRSESSNQLLSSTSPILHSEGRVPDMLRGERLAPLNTVESHYHHYHHHHHDHPRQQQQQQLQLNHQQLPLAQQHPQPQQHYQRQTSDISSGRRDGRLDLSHLLRQQSSPITSNPARDGQ